MKGQHLKPPLHSVVSCYSVIFILLMNSDSGLSQEIGSSQTITALVGADVILLCYLKPAVDVVSKSLEWGRLDLEPRFVHVWHEGQDLLTDQNPSYRGRTSLSTEKLKHGDLSLSLSAVKHSDNGRYRCYFPSQSKTSYLDLVVGSFSPPDITGININSKELLLQCESRGWFPEPEVLWLDSEGNLLSAGPTETVRGSDDLYTVSSRLTVEKRHGNNITCRVQQNLINQNRETWIKVTAECFAEASLTMCSALRLSIILVVFLGLVCAAALSLWKWRQNIITKTKHEMELREKLLNNYKMEAKQSKHDELEKKYEEQKQLEEAINMLNEQRNELKTLKEHLTSQNYDMDKEQGDNEKKLQSVDDKTKDDRGKGFYDLKEIILESKGKMTKRKQQHEQLQMKTQTLLFKTDTLIKKLREKKEEVEKLKAEINEQLKRLE